MGSKKQMGRGWHEKLLMGDGGRDGSMPSIWGTREAWNEGEVDGRTDEMDLGDTVGGLEGNPLGRAGS
jgi:hypothetical protein